MPISRRTFLKSIGVAAGALGAAPLLAACGEGGGIPSGNPTLSVIIASFETLTGDQRPVAFGLRTVDNEEVADAVVEVWLREVGGDVLGGPFPAEYNPPTETGLGVYLSHLDLSESGTVELVAVTGDTWGPAALNVKTPEQAEVLAPGEAAISTPTPTEADPLGFSQICTQDPPCGMHGISLDEALQESKPIVLIFATPAFCQTAVCGPAVGTVDGVREAGDWGETIFIHSEIFTDAGQTIGSPVTDWGLPTEPWLFTIDASGTIADRLDGPMVASVVEAMASEIATA